MANRKIVLKYNTKTFPATTVR